MRYDVYTEEGKRFNEEEPFNTREEAQALIDSFADSNIELIIVEVKEG